MQMRRFFPALALLASFTPPALAQTQTPAAPAASQVPTADAAYYFLLGRHLEGEGQIEEAIAARRFRAIVVDHDDYRYMRLLREHYLPAGELPGSFRPRRGPASVPQRLYLARD